VQIAYPRLQRWRRQRVEWTPVEDDNLRAGVARYGHSWQRILHTFRFHEQRTAADLKKHYARMLKKVYCSGLAVATCC